jgi:hypothetical protein
MRAKLTVAAVILGLATLINGPAFGGDFYEVEVAKVVEGDGPAGPYAVNVTCTNEFVPPAGPFDLDVSDGESVEVQVNFNDECTVTETDDLGADAVTYACEPVVQSTCVNDQTVAIDLSDAGGTGTVTITNTFEPEPDAAPDTATRQPGVVAAQPAFTG